MKGDLLQFKDGLGFWIKPWNILESASYAPPRFKFLTFGFAIARAGLRPLHSRKRPSCKHWTIIGQMSSRNTFPIKSRKCLEKLFSSGLWKVHAATSYSQNIEAHKHALQFYKPHPRCPCTVRLQGVDMLVPHGHYYFVDIHVLVAYYVSRCNKKMQSPFWLPLNKGGSWP
jgi:hypothetical protein